MFKDLYKSAAHFEEERQEQRRLNLLLEQKRLRMELQDSQRFKHAIPSDTENKKKTYTGKHCALKNSNGNAVALQMSEWLRERPEELSDWCLVPCPVGERCLVVAHGKQTVMYNKAGKFRFTFRSQLPGGDRKSHRFTTILDCVYAADKFFVLDVLAFGQQEFIDCEAEFRFFWLRSQWEENEELSVRSRLNNKPFVLLEQYDFGCPERVAYALQQHPLWPNNRPALDGFLLYHKEASYVGGTTPLVCWLFGFMVSDMLGLMTNEVYVPPADYENPHQYMTLFDARLEKKRANRKNHAHACNAAMEIENAESEEPSLEALLEAERMLELEGSLPFDT